MLVLRFASSAETVKASRASFGQQRDQIPTRVEICSLLFAKAPLSVQAKAVFGKLLAKQTAAAKGFNRTLAHCELRCHMPPAPVRDESNMTELGMVLNGGNDCCGYPSEKKHRLQVACCTFGTECQVEQATNEASSAASSFARRSTESKALERHHAAQNAKPDYLRVAMQRLLVVSCDLWLWN